MFTERFPRWGTAYSVDLQPSRCLPMLKKQRNPDPPEVSLLEAFGVCRNCCRGVVTHAVFVPKIPLGDHHPLRSTVNPLHPHAWTCEGDDQTPLAYPPVMAESSGDQGTSSPQSCIRAMVRDASCPVFIDGQRGGASEHKVSDYASCLLLISSWAIKKKSHAMCRATTRPLDDPPYGLGTNARSRASAPRDLHRPAADAGAM